MDSILGSIKTLLGIEPYYTEFDDELIMYINGAFTTLNQLGVGIPGYSITGYDNTWAEFLSNPRKYNSAKTDVFLRVKMIFDPPTSSAVIDSMNSIIKENDWRLMINAESDLET